MFLTLIQYFCWYTLSLIWCFKLPQYPYTLSQLLNLDRMISSHPVWADNLEIRLCWLSMQIICIKALQTCAATDVAIKDVLRLLFARTWINLQQTTNIFICCWYFVCLLLFTYFLHTCTWTWQSQEYSSHTGCHYSPPDDAGSHGNHP